MCWKVRSRLTVPGQEKSARYRTSDALVLEAFALAGILCSVGRLLFTDAPGNILKVSSSVLSTWTLKKGPIRFPERSVNNYQPTLSNNREERRFKKTASFIHDEHSVMSLFRCHAVLLFYLKNTATGKYKTGRDIPRLTRTIVWKILQFIFSNNFIRFIQEMKDI